MRADQDQTSFVAIGGLGGSGTRIVAELVQKSGVYLGPTLNAQLDNLLFTLLFKRRNWFTDFPPNGEIDRMIDIFASAMRDGVGPAFEHIPPEEVEDWFKNSEGMGVNRARFEDILKSPPPDLSQHTGLGWKEPNTHVFLPQLVRRVPNMKYIHVMRNGLDMALSGNRQQLVNWGRHYGIDPVSDDSDTTSQLKYWLASNRQILAIGQTMKPGHFYALNYDDLCLNFTTAVGPLQAFLGRTLTDADMDYFSGHVGSSSIGRFRSAPADTFTDAQRRDVQSLGFMVE